MFGNFAKIGRNAVRATLHDYFFIILARKKIIYQPQRKTEALLYPALLSDNSQCKHHISLLPDF